jgi:hypothetical protein
MKAIVDSQFYRKEYHDLGEVSLPSDHTQATHIERGLDIGGLIKIYGITVSKNPPDRGHVAVVATVGIRNVSDIMFDKIGIMIELTDPDANIIDCNEHENFVPPRSAKLIEAGCWRMKKSQLKDVKAKVTLFVFHPVDSKMATADLKKV